MTTTPQAPTESLPPFTISADYAAKLAKAQAVAQTPKAGVATSEFWLQIAALLVPAILQVLDHSGNVVVIGISQIAAAVYTVARTWVKARATKSAGEIVQALVSQ